MLEVLEIQQQVANEEEQIGMEQFYKELMYIFYALNFISIF